MGKLTRVPLGMLDPGNNASPNDDVVYNGSEIEVQTPGDSSDEDNYVTRGDFDPEIGVLNLYRADSTIVQVPGFMTVHNIGVGPRGATGPRGAPGNSGRNGRDGRSGVPGCAGPKGDVGPQGPAGPRGPAGQRGERGATGPQGPAGGEGASGYDGESPVLVSTDAASSESVSSGRSLQWGRFTDPTPGLTKEIIFPEALNDVSNPHSIVLFWVNPASNVANKVRVTSIETGKANLSVVTNLLDVEPDGSGGTQNVTASGWDFYWILLGD